MTFVHFKTSDSAVLTGALTWVKLNGENRTTARFSLTLSLSHSQYPSAKVGDRVYVTGALVSYGDGETSGDNPLSMEVQYRPTHSNSLHSYAEACPTQRK